MNDVGHVNSLEEVTDATGRAAELQPESSDFINMLTQGCTFEKHVPFCKTQILYIQQCCVRNTDLTTLWGQSALHLFGLTAVSDDAISCSKKHDDSCSKAFMSTTMDSQCICFNSCEIPVEGLRQTYARPELGFQLENESVHL